MRQFSIATTTLATPALLFPPADTATNDSFPDFDWSDVAGASQYRLQVGKGNRWVWAANGYSGVYVLNASDSSAIQHIHTASFNNIHQLVRRDTLLFACRYDQIYISSVANPYTVTQFATFACNNAGAAVQDTILYVGAQNKGLRTVNIANPAAPVEVGRCDTTVTVSDLKVAGDRVYMLAGGYLKVVDVADPAAPAVLGTLPMNNARALDVAGSYVYTASGSTGLQVVDVSNPAAPVLQGSCYTSGNFQKLKVSGGYAYVAAASGGLRVINVSNPANPVEFGSYPDLDYVQDVDLAGHYAYVSDYYDGLALIDVSDPYHPRCDAVYYMENNETFIVADSFAAVVVDTVVAASACEADTFVGDGRRYWRARAGAGAWGPWSAARRFIMDTQPPSKTWNSWPSANLLINDPTPALDYNDIADAWRYRVQVCRDSAFAVNEADTLVPAGACTLQTALGDGRHWWRARARDLAGNWAPWSDSTWFRLDTQAPGAPGGITANGANPSGWTKTNNFAISFTPPFDSSAIDRYFYKKGGPPSSAYDTTGYGMAWSAPINGMTADGSGTTPFYLWARDAAGNLDHAAAARVDLRYDSIPPKGARATANEFSRTPTFTVSWSGASDQGGSGLSGRYWIKQKVNGGSWTDLNTYYAGTSYVYSGSQGNKYYFEVAALDSAVNNEAFAGAAECSTMVDNTITAPILVSPYNGAVRDSAATLFRWQRAAAQAGSRLQCAYDASFTALARDTVLPADSAVVVTLADSLYYWRARGQDSPTDTSAWTPARTLRIDTQAPAAPFLASPGDDTLTNDNTPSFEWKPAAGATAYRLQLAADSGFAAPIRDVATDSTAHTIDITLLDSAYYWRVRAGDAAGNWSGWSARWRLTVDTRAPAVPAALSPADGATVTTNLPQFRWNASADATRYQLQVSANTSFSPNVLDTALADTAAVPQWGLNDGTRYWRLRCRDAAGNWSAWNAHRTLVISGILQVALTTPAAGSVWTPSSALWIQFSKPLNTSYIDTARVKVRGRHTAIVRQYLTWQAASRTLMVAPDSSFAANDTITVVLHGGLRDSNGVSYLDGDGNGSAAGDSTDNYQLTFYTSHIGDYNRDRLVNAVDLMLFTIAWYSPFDRFYEAGPCGGAWPHQRVWIGNPTGSTKLDFEDLSGFIYSWNRADGKLTPAKGGDGPVTLRLSTDGSALVAEVSPDAGFSAMDAELTLDQAAALGEVAAGQVWRREGMPPLFLTAPSGNGARICAARWPGSPQAGPELFSAALARRPAVGAAAVSYRLYDASGAETAAGVATCRLDGPAVLPPAFALGRAAPNPALRRAAIAYQLPAASRVTLEVYNITGQRVATLVDAVQPAGHHARDWDLCDEGGRRVGAGVYFYKLNAGAYHSIGKLTVVR